eukprot:1160328-Pelagomonas_calceolata.AAC.3
MDVSAFLGSVTGFEVCNKMCFYPGTVIWDKANFANAIPVCIKFAKICLSKAYSLLCHPLPRCVISVDEHFFDSEYLFALLFACSAQLQRDLNQHDRN